MDECAEQRRRLSEEFQSSRRVFIALGDETRQQIFITLLEHEPVGMRVPEITVRTHLSRPAVSHHLKILREARLIGMHREGTRNYYYAAAGSGFWHELKALAEHVAKVADRAAASGYPHFPDDERRTDHDDT